MGDEKKSTSFLYNLFQRYKDFKNDTQDSPDDPAAEIIKRADADAAEHDRLRAAQQNLKDAVEKETVVLPTSSRIDESKIKYLEPLFQIYSDLAKAVPGNTPIDNLQQFESWVLAHVQNLPFFTQYRREITDFLRELSKLTEAMKINLAAEKSLYELQLQQYYASMEAQPPDKSRHPSMPSQPPPIDSTVHICVIGNKMHALLFLLPPYRGGKDIDENRIAAELKKSKIVFGLNQPLLDDIAEGGRYLQIFPIAEGVYPVKGKDGQIIHEIDCDDELDIQEDEHGNVDFRNLNLFHTVELDEVICKIIPEEEGSVGQNLYGDKLVPPVPKKPVVPMGKNTIISEDGSKLIASAGGHIKLYNGRYNIEPVLVIKNNVDYSVGNLDFPGDIIIYGDVCNGFQVKAQNDITIHGMVENASIIANGDVLIQKGMNGNHTGTIETAGSVKTSFLENCIVYCGGVLHADSIVSCKVYCEDTVSVLGARGVIIGGTITAFRSVEARMIGSKSRRETNIILGEMPRQLTKKDTIQTELKEVYSTLDKLALNIKYLNNFKEDMPNEKRNVFTQLLSQQDLYLQRKQHLEEELSRLDNISLDYESCFIKCNMVFPITKISIGADSYTVDSVLSKCRISFSDGEIHQGTF